MSLADWSNRHGANFWVGECFSPGPRSRRSQLNRLGLVGTKRHASADWRRTSPDLDRTSGSAPFTPINVRTFNAATSARLHSVSSFSGRRIVRPRPPGPAGPRPARPRFPAGCGCLRARVHAVDHVADVADHRGALGGRAEEAAGFELALRCANSATISAWVAGGERVGIQRPRRLRSRPSTIRSPSTAPPGRIQAGVSRVDGKRHDPVTECDLVVLSPVRSRPNRIATLPAAVLLRPRRRSPPACRRAWPGRARARSWRRREVLSASASWRGRNAARRRSRAAAPAANTALSRRPPARGRARPAVPKGRNSPLRARRSRRSPRAAARRGRSRGRPGGVAARSVLVWSVPAIGSGLGAGTVRSAPIARQSPARRTDRTSVPAAFGRREQERHEGQRRAHSRGHFPAEMRHQRARDRGAYRAAHEQYRDIEPVDPTRAPQGRARRSCAGRRSCWPERQRPARPPRTAGPQCRARRRRPRPRSPQPCRRSRPASTRVWPASASRPAVGAISAPPAPANAKRPIRLWEKP